MLVIQMLFTDWLLLGNEKTGLSLLGPLLTNG